MSTADLTPEGQESAAPSVGPSPVQPEAKDAAAEPTVARNRRILIIDDNQAIHTDFRKILCADHGSELKDMEATLFGQSVTNRRPQYEIDSAYQGQEGVAKVDQARAEGRPYAMAFVEDLPGHPDRAMHGLCRLFLG